MTTKDENITMGLDRLNALFAWWGIPAGNGSGAIDGQMKRFQVFAADLQTAYGEAYSRQVNALLTANERIAGSLQAFLRCRQPQDVVAVESDVLATILEGASLQAKSWAELTQKVQDCCTAMARETADELRQQTSESPSAKVPAKAAASPARDGARHQVHA